MSSDTKFDHIDLAERQKVLNECVEGEAWLREKRHQQDPLPKYVNPVLLSADIRKNADALDRICRPIMMKHKPSKPTTPEPTSPSPSQGAENTDSCPNENDESMETEKPNSPPGAE